MKGLLYFWLLLLTLLVIGLWDAPKWREYGPCPEGQFLTGDGKCVAPEVK